MTLFSIFDNTILPIFVVAGAGFLLARYLHADVKALSQVTFNVLSPCLVFNTLVTAELSPSEFGRMAAFAACLIVTAGVLAWVTSLVLRLERPMTSAFVSVAMFANAGNYGLPLVLFAFGQEALTRATVYFVIHMVLLYSVGIMVASSSRGSWHQVVKSIVRVPHLYAILAALVFIVTGAAVPTPVMRPIALLNNAALPMMVLLLGMQLERTALPKRLGVVGLATAGRLVVLPLLALALAAAFGLTGADRQAAVIQASMPAAVMVTVLAVEFQTEPAFVNAVVFLSTVLSPLTLTPLIAFLQR